MQTELLNTKQDTDANVSDGNSEKSHLREFLEQCFRKYQPVFWRPTIIQINIEDIFISLKGFENISDASNRLSLLRDATEKALVRTDETAKGNFEKKFIKKLNIFLKLIQKQNKINLNTDEKIRSIKRLRDVKAFIEIIKRGYNGYVGLSINFGQIEELKVKLSDFKIDINKSGDFSEYFEKISNFEIYLKMFTKKHKDYSSYDDGKLLEVYVELKNNKEGLDQVLAGNFIKV